MENRTEKEYYEQTLKTFNPNGRMGQQEMIKKQKKGIYVAILSVLPIRFPASYWVPYTGSILLPRGAANKLPKMALFLHILFSSLSHLGITSFHSNTSRRGQVLDCIKNALFHRFGEVNDTFPAVPIKQVQSCSPYKTLKQVMVFFRSGLTRQLYAVTVQDWQKENYVVRMQVHPRKTSHNSHDVRVLWHLGKMEIVYLDCATG